MKRQRRVIILGLVGLGAAVGAGATLGAGPAPSPQRLAPDTIAAALRTATAEARAGRAPRADQILRAVLSHDADHRAAAEQLRTLHRGRSVDPPADEAAVRETMALLGRGFTRIETEHFVVLSDADNVWTRTKADLLERTLDQFHRAMRHMGLESVPPEHKLLCVLINDHAAYVAFARTHDGVEGAWVSGYYASLGNRVVFYNDATGPAFIDAQEQLDGLRDRAEEAQRLADEARRQRQGQLADRLRTEARRYMTHADGERLRLADQAAIASLAKTTHEAAHLVAFNCGLQSRAHQYPFWLSEGFATNFEAISPRAPFGPDRPVAHRLEAFAAAIQANQLIPLERFIPMTSLAGELSADQARQAYAQAYALFRYLYRYERAALAAFFRDLQAQPAGNADPVAVLTLFQRRFGELRALERRWLDEQAQTLAQQIADARDVE